MEGKNSRLSRRCTLPRLMSYRTRLFSVACTHLSLGDRGKPKFLSSFLVGCGRSCLYESGGCSVDSRDGERSGQSWHSVKREGNELHPKHDANLKDRPVRYLESESALEAQHGS